MPHVTLNKSSNSMSGTLNKATPLPGIVQNLHVTALFLCLICSWHIPYYIMFVLLYICKYMLIG